MKTLSIIIPVYNEARRLDRTYKALKTGLHVRGLKLERIIFVNDGSTDTTLLKLKDLSTQLETLLDITVSVISYDQNMGKGHAVRVGMLSNRSDYALFCDADMSTPLKELRKFVPYVLDGEEVIIGTRKSSQADISVSQSMTRQLLGHAFTHVANFITPTGVSDFTCGFKLFSRKAAQYVFGRATIDKWGYDAEILFLAHRRGYRIVEIPVRWADVAGSRVQTYRAIVTTLGELFHIRINHLLGKYAKKNGAIGQTRHAELVSASI